MPPPRSRKPPFIAGSDTWTRADSTGTNNMANFMLAQPAGGDAASDEARLFPMSWIHGDWSAESKLPRTRAASQRPPRPAGLSGSAKEQRAQRMHDHQLNPFRFANKAISTRSGEPCAESFLAPFFSAAQR